MSIQITGNVLSVKDRLSKWIDKDTGASKERNLRDVRFMVGDDIGVITGDADKMPKVKSGQEIVCAVRKLDEKGGFFLAYGEILRVR